MIGAGTKFEEDIAQFINFSVQEFMSGGSLDGKLWNTPQESVTWHEKLTWAADVCEGMQFIHSRGYAHRDLKSQNILCCKISGRAKVADFGFSRATTAKPTLQNLIMRGSSDDALMTACGVGTPQYMAPELCTNQVEMWEKRQEVPKNVKDPKHDKAMRAYHKFRGDY